MTRLTLFFCVVLLASAGCKDSDREQLRKVGGKGVEHLRELTGGPDGRLASSLDALRGAASDRTADSRAASRVRWDKETAGSAVTARLARPGVVVLEGTVPSAEARARAVALARSTVGVDDVVDALRVVVPPPPAKK